MLVQKLRVNDLQSEKGYFDGVMVYAQNKVTIQVIKLEFKRSKLTSVLISSYFYTITF